MSRGRVYLDWNASAPLRPEARRAMVATLDLAGNPSSVHAEGRAARAVIERARAQVAAAAGAGDADVVFVSGATEAAALACAGRGLRCAPLEHEAVLAWCEPRLTVDGAGAVRVAEPAASALQAANSETGIVQDLPPGIAVVDACQVFGKAPFDFAETGAGMALVSAHKIGGPKGVGALILRRGTELSARIRGGGQEQGRRAGTEAVAAVAGFGAAAEAAAGELEEGAWDAVARRRDMLEAALSDRAAATISVGRGRARLPGTLCLVTPGWAGATQVMQMDLAGFAVSAGSACSSGKIRASGTLRAMGLDEDAAGSAIRVSMGPGTSDDDAMRFVEAWCGAERKFRAKAA